MNLEMDSGPVIGLGQASLDFLGRAAGYPPRDSKCELDGLIVQGGGPAATAMVTVRRLGLRAAFIGAVGEDEFGPMIRAGLVEEGVDVSGLRVEIGAGSQAAFIVVDGVDAARTIFWRRGPSEWEVTAEDLERIRRSRALHLDGLNLQASLAAAEAAREAGIPVFYDAGTLRPGALDLAALTDHLICSEVFFKAFYQGPEVREGLEALMKLGPKQVAVTLGPEGSVGLDETGLYRLPAYAVKAVDTTGAGDVFHGAYLVATLKGGTLPERLDFASAVAALKCEKMGGRAGIPNLARVREFMRVNA